VICLRTRPCPLRVSGRNTHELLAAEGPSRRIRPGCRRSLWVWPVPEGWALGAWVRKGQPAESGRRVRRRRAWGRAAAGLL